jgi:hypothetical protein
MFSQMIIAPTANGLCTGRPGRPEPCSAAKPAPAERLEQGFSSGNRAPPKNLKRSPRNDPLMSWWLAVPLTSFGVLERPNLLSKWMLREHLWVSPPGARR